MRIRTVAQDDIIQKPIADFGAVLDGTESDIDGGANVAGQAQLIVAKQRNGPTGTVKLQFIGKFGKFTEWGYQHNPDLEGAYNRMSENPAPGNTITLPSRMNEDEENQEGDDLNVPF